MARALFRRLRRLQHERSHGLQLNAQSSCTGDMMAWPQRDDVVVSFAGGACTVHKLFGAKGVGRRWVSF
jgi:hypothetical protein